MEKRQLEVVVISDVHLGTYGCHAKELKSYLKSIQPETLILNGDIIDIWQFRKRYFPENHMSVLKEVLKLASKGTQVYYLTGNHDEMLRRFSDFSVGNLHLADKLVLELDGQKHWFFHGDIFDASIQNAKWLAKLGGWGYDLLILLNRAMNFCLELLGRERYSLSKIIKSGVKNAVKYIQNFEETACELAVAQGYDFVVCGHIHQPQIEVVNLPKGTTTYMNSGDWVENLTALEYQAGTWQLYKHEMSRLAAKSSETEDEVEVRNLQQLIEKITAPQWAPNG